MGQCERKHFQDLNGVSESFLEGQGVEIEAKHVFDGRVCVSTFLWGGSMLAPTLFMGGTSCTVPDPFYGGASKKRRDAREYTFLAWRAV